MARMSWRFSFALSLGGAVAVANAATYTGTLTGPKENPPNASPGTGTAFAVLDITAHKLRVSATFAGLTSTTTAAHIHCCSTAPTNAGVATTTPSFSGFPLGVTSGTFDQTYDTTLSSTWNPAFITANGGTVASAEAALAAGMAAGQAYFNIHTTTSGGGEIRSFLAVQILDIDANGRVDALTDGLLMLRYFFGLRGSTLVNGAMGPGAMRSPAAVESYLLSLNPQ